jgi:hypothetical protein
MFRNTIWNSMQTHPKDERVLMMATYSYMVVSRVCNDQTLDAADHLVTCCILDAISIHGADCGLKIVACSYFESLLRKVSQDEYQLKIDILTGILRMTSDCSKAVALRACQTVSAYLNWHPDALNVLTCSDESAGALIMAMDTHIYNQDIVQYLVQFAILLFGSSDYQLRYIFANCGGLNALANCLGAHDINLGAQENSGAIMQGSHLEVLIQTVAVANDEILFGQRLSVSLYLIRVLECVIDKNDSPVQVLQAMTALCMRCDFFCFIFSAAIPALQSLSHHFDDFSASLHVTRLVLMATTADNSLSLANTRRGSLIQLLVSLMAAHSSSDEILFGVLDSLRLLKADSSMQEDLNEHSFVAAIVATMRVNHSRPDILGSAFAAINNIVVNFARPVIRPLKNETLDTLMSTMSQHPVEEYVQSSGLSLLKCYASETESVRLMKRRMDELFPVLYSASTNCSPECAASAEHIMRQVDRI